MFHKHLTRYIQWIITTSSILFQAVLSFQVLSSSLFDVFVVYGQHGGSQWFF